MSELSFESILTMEEVEQNFADVDFFSGLMEGLRDALAWEKGEVPAGTMMKIVSSSDTTDEAGSFPS